MAIFTPFRERRSLCWLPPGYLVVVCYCCKQAASQDTAHWNLGNYAEIFPNFVPCSHSHTEQPRSQAGIQTAWEWVYTGIGKSAPIMNMAGFLVEFNYGKKSNMTKIYKQAVKHKFLQENKLYHSSYKNTKGNTHPQIVLHKL